MSGNISCCWLVTHSCGGLLSTGPFPKSRDCWMHLGWGCSQYHVDDFSLLREVQQATTTPAHCDGGQKNTQKAQGRGWVSYNSDSPSVLVLDLCFEGRRFETQTEGNAKILQMIAALSWPGLSPYHSSLIPPCHRGAKALWLWWPEPHRSRSDWALAGEHDGSVSTLLVPGPTTMTHSCFIILFLGK